MLAAYVTGHGFGHATRTAEVLRHVRRLRPDLPLAVVTTAPERLFRAALAEPFLYRPQACDVGVVQRDALVLDETATAEAWATFAAGGPARVDAEATWLREQGVKVVLGDIPPLAFEAAAAAGVPAIALGNFSWDWIYRHLARNEPRLSEAADACAAAYRSATLLLRLPFAGDLSAFPRQEGLPLLAREAARAPQAVRDALGLPHDRPVVLLSFGGLGLGALDTSRFARLDRFHFVTLAGPRETNVTPFTGAGLDDLGIAYQDLVAAADVVVSKPGYGIVTDCIAVRTRLLYTDRGDFPEYPVMVGEMPRYLPCRHVTQRALFEADLGEPLAALLQQPWPPRPDVSGAQKAARRVLSFA
jgi:hypothetical protein